MLDRESCYRAMLARDARFDGVFFVGVRTTGVYCRPVCTARTPRADRCSFHASSAQAEKAGFRACFRCRPELAPGNATVDAIPRLVAQAVDRIEEGCLNERGVDALAAELGVTARHLRRSMEDKLGVSPVELAQSRRLALAKRLLQDTRLGLATVAFTSGFRSVRRFNALFAARFGRAPSSLRREHGDEGATPSVRLRLDYRPPLEWSALLGFLGDRAIPGVERVSGNEYQRVVCLEREAGIVRVRPDPVRPALWADVSPSLAPRLMKLVAKLRALFDLDARPDAIADALSRDRTLAPVVRKHPGLRLPGSVDPFEVSVRAVLGQQISVRAATTLAGRLVQRFGAPIEAGAQPGLTHRFPDAVELAAATAGEIGSIGLPRRRAETLRALAVAFASGSVAAPGPATDVERFVGELLELPGVGEWTAQYVAMRALHHPDAFPASDLWIRKALGGVDARAATARAERWRPWRSYAAIHLWISDAPGDSS